MQTRPVCDKGLVCSFVGEFHFPGSRDPDVVPLSVLLWFSIKKKNRFIGKTTSMNIMKKDVILAM